MLGLAEMTVLGLLTSGQLEGHQDERARWWIPSTAVHAARHSSEASTSTDLSIEQTIPIAAPVSSTDSPATTAGEDVGEHTGEQDEERADASSSSGYTTTKQAAKALGVSRRTVQSYVRRGELEAVVEGEGVEKTFYVSIASLHALRERRSNSGEGTSEDAENASASSSSSGLSAKATQSAYGEGPNLIEVVQDLQYRLGRAEAKVELTERTESTLREQLAHERERANRLEAELRREARRSTSEPRDAAERAMEDVSDSKTPSSNVEESRASWWQRWFGGG